MSQTTETWFLIITSGKCRPIYTILSLLDSWGNFVHIYYTDSPPHLKYVSTLPCETEQLQLLPISMADCMWDLRIHLERYEAALIAQVWILWIPVVTTIKSEETMQQCLEEDPWCPSANELWKSVNICRSCHQRSSVLFFFNHTVQIVQAL